jgi:septum formation protein
VVILASGSPRRNELLARVAYPFRVIPAHVDETRRPGETPETLVRRLAEEKACRVSGEHDGDWVLGADTIVTLDGTVFGKPSNAAEAATTLQSLAGREHQVLTAIAWARGGRIAASDVVCTRVGFRDLDRREIDAYVDSGEPADKAGAYAIQGGAAALGSALHG